MEVVERPTLAQIFRRFFRRFRKERDLTEEQRKAAWCIQACRTPALGGVEVQCERCQKTLRIYCSCGNRHGPQCQTAQSLEWLGEQESRLLPVAYFHVVFTIPSELHLVFRYNRRRLYGVLFEVSAWVLKKFGSDPQWLGAQLGFLGVLHTWGQQLVFHPHIHYLVPQGGLDDQGRWVSPKQGLNGKFLFPVVAVSQVFRGKLLARLEKLHADRKLKFPDPLTETGFGDTLRIAASKDWEVYAKKPFAGPGEILKYLGRYTHRVAIGARRLLRMDENEVQIEYKDYRAGGERKRLGLRGEEFLGRFLEHVLPKGFRRIRGYGFWANRAGSEAIERVQAAWLSRLGALLTVLTQWAEREEAREQEQSVEAAEKRVRCPCCPEGWMWPIRQLAPEPMDSS